MTSLTLLMGPFTKVYQNSGKTSSWTFIKVENHLFKIGDIVADLKNENQGERVKFYV